MLITRNSIRDYVYLFRWISLSSLVFSTSSLSFPRPFLFFTKELPRISGRRLVSNSFINPLALFRISFSPPPPSFSFFLLYLFLSLSLYLRHPKQLSTIRIPFISFGRIIQFRKSKIRKLKSSRLVRGSFIQTSSRSSRNKGD